MDVVSDRAVYSFPNSVVDYISLIAFCSGYPVTHLISDPYSSEVVGRRCDMDCGQGRHAWKPSEPIG